MRAAWGCWAAGVWAAILLGGAAAWGAGSPARVVDLRCEYQANPLGLDTPRPRLSWRLEDDRRGARQTAYQVLAASSPERLAAGRADLWDSGRVASDQSVHVAYAGERLGSRQRVYWRVRVWDQDGRPSAWSETAWWEMGLLSPDDWQARWISPADMEILNRPIRLSPWYGHPQAADAETVYFRTVVTYEAGPLPHHAIVAVSAHDAYELWVNGHRAGAGEGAGEAEWHTLWGQANLRRGRNVIAVRVRSRGGRAALALGLRQTFYGGRVVERPPGGWRCATEAPKNWAQPDFADGEWPEAVVAGRVGEPPLGDVRQTFDGPRRSQLLRRRFLLPSPPQTARAYVTGLGLYELRINGRRVGRDVFTPGWTLYDKRLQYQTYDVTGYLREGPNAVGAVLGNGWWSSGLGWAGGHERHAKPGQNLRFLLQLEVVCRDGSRRVLVTDPSWRSHPSPILEDTFYHGETYDARLEQPGWDRPEFTPEGWGHAVVVRHPLDILCAQKGPPLRVTETLRPAAITEPQPGVWVFDFGQNHAGRPRLRVRASAGTTIRIRHAEVLGPDGLIDNVNYRSARATDTYICRGGGEEVWSPRFTYRGFRYAQVTGLPGEPTPETLVSEVLHSAAPPAGRFACSHDLVNRIWSNVLWGQRSNLHSVPTDCPQRDERLGWMGDAQAFAPTSIWNMDMALFYTKWMRDIADSQHEDGATTGVSPRIVVDGAGRAAWADAVTIIPWQVYRYYGDRRILEENYEPMRKWVEYIAAHLEGDLYEKPTWGDWVPVVPTPELPVSACYGFYSTKLLARMAAVLGKQEDAKRYGELAQRQAAAFQAKYFHADTKQYVNGTQTANLLPLAFGVTPPQLRQAVADNVAADVKRRGGHHSTGFLGTTVILPMLAQYGHADLAWRIISSDEYPSLGYMVRQGATTVWERWNTDQMGPEMNSRNHFAFGSMVQWLYEGVAGINVDAERPGFKHVIIRPYVVEGLDWARAEHRSPYGPVAVGWERDGDGLNLRCAIPPNTTATVYLPAAAPDEVREGGTPLAEAAGLSDVRREDGRVVVEAAAGRYVFRIR